MNSTERFALLRDEALGKYQQLLADVGFANDYAEAAALLRKAAILAEALGEADERAERQGPWFVTGPLYSALEAAS